MLPLKMLLNDFLPGGVVVGVGLLDSVHDLCKYVLVMKLRELS